MVELHPDSITLIYDDNMVNGELRDGCKTLIQRFGETFPFIANNSFEISIIRIILLIIIVQKIIRDKLKDRKDCEV